MTKGKRAVISIFLAVFLLLSLPVLYLCGVNIYIGLAHGTDNKAQSLLMYIIAFAVVILLDIIATIGMVKIFKDISSKNSQMQTEDLGDTHVRRKYLRNPWFALPLILPAICFLCSTVTGFVFWLRYETNISRHTIDLLDPYVRESLAYGTFSSLLIIFAAIPHVITGIILAGIKKITLPEMLVSFAIYFFVFFFAIIVIASKA